MRHSQEISTDRLWQGKENADYPTRYPQLTRPIIRLEEPQASSLRLGELERRLRVR